MKRKFPRWLLVAALLSLALAALIPTIPLLHKNSLQSAHAMSVFKGPIISHHSHHPQTRPHRTSKGVDRTHLLTLNHLSQSIHSTRTNAQGKSAWASGNINPNNTTTIFSDTMESGAPGWTTVGDGLSTSYYPNGHDFWNLLQNPQNYGVSSAVNPPLVSYPDATGLLPTAHSGTHAWGYEDTNIGSSGSSTTYMGNSNDWPSETGGQNGGISNGPNSGSLISPVVDLTSAPNATLTFATWWEIESTNPTNFDMMNVDVTTDGGTTWNSLGVLNPTQNPSGGTDPYPYTDNGLDAPASWQIASADLTPYIGSKVQVRFRFDTVDQYDNGFRGWLIDDVGVYSNTAGSPLISTTTPNTGVAGDTITIAGSSFGAQQGSSTVTFNGVTAHVQSWSNTNIVVTVPQGATSGPLIITVNGTPTASVGFTINANVMLSSPTSFPQTTNSVSGQGFAANEPIALYLNGVNGTLLASATANSSGNLPPTNISIPILAATNYLILAVGTHSHITAGTTLSILPSIIPAVTTVKPGQSISLTTLGFVSEGVEIYLDTVNNSPLTQLSCDNSGSCSGNASMPTNNIVQGPHTLIAIGYNSGLIAETTVTFIPTLAISQTSGGPGTQITLSGAAFAANETLQVYWGTNTGLSEGTGTTDGQGNLSFTFNAPTGIKPGSYTITLVRSHQNPATLTTSFKVLPPTFTSTAGIKTGQPINITLSGFQASEAVAISWNANGGQQLTTIGTDATGAASTSFTPSSAPRGTYTLTATGSSSGLKATSPLNVGPGILLTPSSANPGGTITVTGGGFSAAEKITVYFQNTSNGTIPVTADATGAFTTALTIPVKYSTSISYYVYVNGTNKENLKAFFSYVLPGLTTYSNATYGQQSTFYGQGFVANETVHIQWDYQQSGQVKVTDVKAASDGTFQATFIAPSDPNLGYVTVAAIGATSNLKATTSVYEYPGLVLSPSSGIAGTRVHATGGGFASGELVTVTFNGATIVTATASITGTWSTSFGVPTTTTLGGYSVQATGGTSGISTSTTFNVTPKIVITPTMGTSSTSIKVTGTLFTPNSTAYLYWYDPSTGGYSLGGFATSANGTFTTTITPPISLLSGNTYYVQVYDGPTNEIAQAAFVAQ